MNIEITKDIKFIKNIERTQKAILRKDYELKCCILTFKVYQDVNQADIFYKINMINGEYKHLYVLNRKSVLNLFNTHKEKIVVYNEEALK